MKKFVRPVIVILITLCLLFCLQRLVTPKYVDDIVEGALVAEYYKEKDKSFDVLFVGDCEVYENFSPQVLWDEYGINSYIRGSAQQYIWQSYYLLEDCLRDYTPDTVVFNVLSLQYDTTQSEAYNRMSIEGMRWNSSKVGSIMASMTPEESFADYLFPILRYHSRWSELKSTDFEYMFKEVPNVAFNGYYMRVDALPAKDVPTGKPLMDYSFGDNAWNYLDKIRTLCGEKGINLILIKAPSLYPYWYEQWDEQVEEYAKKHDLLYINFLELQEEIGLDFNTDTYDSGLHLNLSGAEKLSRYFGEILSRSGVPDRRDEEGLSANWNEKRKLYNEEIQRQKEKYGL